MRRNIKLIVLLNLLAVLGLFNWSVSKKEKTLQEGTLVLLELAPVDPRSLMQGDYMRLSYALTRQEQENLQRDVKVPSRGYCVVKLDEHQVAQFVRYQQTPDNLQEGELLLKYFKPEWQVNIGAESFFFEEGQAKVYEQAKYSALKTDAQGNSILIGLYDGNRQLIRPESNPQQAPKL